MSIIPDITKVINTHTSSFFTGILDVWSEQLSKLCLASSSLWQAAYNLGKNVFGVTSTGNHNKQWLRANVLTSDLTYAK